MKKSNVQETPMIQLTTNDLEENIMDAADAVADTTSERLSHEEVFDSLRRSLAIDE